MFYNRLKKRHFQCFNTYVQANSIVEGSKKCIGMPKKLSKYSYLKLTINIRMAKKIDLY